SLESIIRSLIAVVALLLVVMLIAGGLVVSGPAILTFDLDQPRRPGSLLAWPMASTRRWCRICLWRSRARWWVLRRERCPERRCVPPNLVVCRLPDHRHSLMLRSARLWRTAYSAAWVRSCNPVLARIAEM